MVSTSVTGFIVVCIHPSTPLAVPALLLFRCRSGRRHLYDKDWIGENGSRTFCVFSMNIHTMKPIRRRNAWTWGKPCSCCAQFDTDQKNKKTRAKKVPKCCFCSEPNPDNNPFPLCEVDDETSMCCDECNESKVLPMRVRVWDCKSPEEARKKALELLSAPPPEAVQVVTVPTEPYSSLHSIITRTMDSYYGYGSPYGGMVGHDSYNPWHSARG